MKYRCNHCDITFESEKKEKVRCPECMGIHDVEPEKEKKTSGPQSKPRLLVPVTVILALVVGAAGWYFTRTTSSTAETAAPDVAPDDVKAQLESLGIETGSAIVPFESTGKIDAFSKKVADGKDGTDAVRAIYLELLKLKKDKKWRAFSQTEPRMPGPLTAGELLEKIQGEESFEASSYEIAALLLAASLSAGVPNAQMVEILNYKKEKTPADPSAVYSRYAIISGDALFDPWAGREEKVENANLIKLDTATATAPFYAHRSLSKFAKLALSESLKDNQIAVELAPENATFKIHRGKIFLGSSAIQEAISEFEKAKKTRNWAVTKVSLAQVQLMTQSDLTDAESAIREALTEFPEYYQAHALLAALFMMRGDADSARQELDIAEKIAPASAEIAATRAQLAAMSGETDKAIEYAKKAVRLSKESFQSLMILAQVYRATARFDEMRKVVNQALEKAPSEAVRDELRKLFQLSETDTPDAEEADENDTDTGANGDLALDLPAPSSPGELKLNLQNDDGASLGGNKLKLGGNNRTGLGGNLKLEMNNQ
ncbi:MAG: tetratricopeptide repeat protein [Deltaproteobacteria bacterium]|nr:tetratricopeptide repeat protein [Deltaproteobacteria bacterium]